MRPTASFRSACSPKAQDGTLRNEIRTADAAAANYNAILTALRRYDTLIHLGAVSRPPSADWTATSSRITYRLPLDVPSGNGVEGRRSSSEVFWRSEKTERVKGRTHHEKE